MTTGARRGELCALRWFDLDLAPERAMAWVRRAISQDEHSKWIESDTKTHQQRHRPRCRDRVGADRAS